MPVMQQAGIRQMGPPAGSASALRALLQPATETTAILRRITETTPPMPLNPASVTGVYNHTIFSPGAGGAAHIEYAVVLRTLATVSGRDPRPDEWITVAPSIVATATHWRLVIDTPSGNAPPGNEWGVDVGNAFLEPDVALWHVNGARMVARGTFAPELIGDEETLTYFIDPGQVYRILSGGLIDWTADVAVRDRIFIQLQAWSPGANPLNVGKVLTIKEIVDADNVIVYEPIEAGGPGDFNIVLVQKANA